MLDQDPDAIPVDDNGMRIKAAFVNKIQALISGYVETISISRARHLRKLYHVSRIVATSNPDIEAAEQLILVAGLTEED